MIPMKNQIVKRTLLFISLLGLENAKAQAPFSAMKYLDVNKFNIGHLVHGDMWYEPSKGAPACEFPKGSGKHAGYMAALWTAATDDLGADYVTAQMYRSAGIDYWPGPLDASGTCSYATSEKWARIWKINQTDIVAFKALSSKTLSTVPVDILEWPAKGNVYAKGAAGAALSITDDMAPFIDVDANGIYDPIKGDYPKIKGDQMLWWVFNDNGATHTASRGGTPLKLEYRTSAYAYSRGTEIDNAVYYEFNMINKSKIRYVDFRFGLFSDADLGSPSDDYIAFDSTHRMGILFNAQIPDAPNGANSYGMNPPLVGVSFINMPGDKYPDAMVPPGAFNYFEGGAVGPIRDPRVANEFKNYMYGKNADGNPMYFGNYAFEIKKGAIQCDSTYPLGDRRFLTTTGNYNFQPSTSVVVAMALMATDTTGNACPKVDFKPLTDLADKVWEVFYNPMPPLGVKEIQSLDKTLRIYPNPANNYLFIDSYTGKELKAERIKVYNVAGMEIKVDAMQNNKQIRLELSSLATGTYTLVYTDNELISSQKFTKR